MSDPALEAAGARQVQPYHVGLNQGTAYWMARCARAAYFRKDDGSPDEGAVLADLGSDNGFQAVVSFHQRGSSAVLIEHSDYFALAFRGTDEPRDWLDNVNAIPTAALFGSFHRGFFRATDRIWPAVLEHYHSRRKELHAPDGIPKALFLTGHSLGGAMATVAASHLIDRDFPFTGVYTFGQPRTMSAKTADVFNIRARGRFYRFQNNNDVVSRVPARVSGYSHVGTYVHIMQNKKIVQEPGFWLQFLDMKAGIVDDIVDGDLATFEDHRMEDYLFAISRWDVAW